jgi:clan AA aspartic protease
MVGSVTPDREAVVRVTLQPARGPELEIDAIVDTGFSGHLTLPSLLIASMGLRLSGRAQVTLADGSMVLADVFFGTIIWFGQPRAIEIDSAETDPLIGMSLLHGSELRVEVVDGGNVVIEALP